MRSLSPYVLALLASVAACGKVQPSTTDGGNTGPDADTSGDATVTTEAAVFGAAIGAKVGNIDIVSTLPNGKVLAAGKTDGTGNGTIKVFPGGAVTAIYKHANDMGAELITWTGVAPGDHLTFGSKQPYSGGVASTNLGSQNYTFPTLAGANVYVVYTSCGANSAPAAGTSVTISEFNTCHIEPMDALYIAYNASSVLIGYNYRQNVAFSNGASVAIGGWGTAANATVTMTGLPPEVTNVNGGFRTIIDGKTAEQFTSFNGNPTGGAFTGNFVTVPTGDRTVGQVTLSRPGFNGMYIFDQFAPNNLTQTIASPTLPPWVQGSVSVSSAVRAASWFTVAGPGAVSDGQMLRMSWSHNIGGTFYPHTWYVMLPPGRNTFSFPEFPPAFVDNTPQPQDSMGASIRSFDVSSATSYDMLRTLSSAVPMCLECALYAGEAQRVVTTP